MQVQRDILRKGVKGKAQRLRAQSGFDFKKHQTTWRKSCRRQFEQTAIKFEAVRTAVHGHRRLAPEDRECM